MFESWLWCDRAIPSSSFCNYVRIVSAVDPRLALFIDGCSLVKRITNSSLDQLKCSAEIPSHNGSGPWFALQCEMQPSFHLSREGGPHSSQKEQLIVTQDSASWSLNMLLKEKSPYAQSQIFLSHPFCHCLSPHTLALPRLFFSCFIFLSI